MNASRLIPQQDIEQIAEDLLAARGNQIPATIQRAWLDYLWSEPTGLTYVETDLASLPQDIEEPEISLHSDVVRFIPQIFARVQRRYGRQIILSTHSSDLLSDEGIGLDEVLLLQPGKGTSVTPANSFEEVKSLLEGGSLLADAVIPHTRPDSVEQLMLFGDI